MKALIFFFLACNTLFFCPLSAQNLSTTRTEIKTEYVSFTLLNKSMKSIPLLIPSVMKPNLSPVSSSGVSLKIGQEILFRYKGKKRVLLVVTKDLEGKKLEVSKLLKEKKQEIDKK